MAKKENYVTVNGTAYAEKMAVAKRAEYGPGYQVRVEAGRIPCWGGVGTEAGHKIIVEKKP